MNKKLWLSRLLIGTVLLINIQSALAFFFTPDRYAPFYELSGPVGAATIQGFGVLFLMWNVPYIFALTNPIKFRISLYQAVIMQTIGLVGESIILWQLPNEHSLLGQYILRFIIFDGGGLIFLMLAVIVTRRVYLE